MSGIYYDPATNGNYNAKGPIVESLGQRRNIFMDGHVLAKGQWRVLASQTQQKSSTI